MLDVPLPPKRARPPRPPPTNKTEGFYGPISLWERIKEIASKEQRSASDLVVGWLERCVREYDAEHGKPQEPGE